jgi:hypothetical protein
MARTRTWLQQAQERRIWHSLLAYPAIVFVVLQIVGFFINHQGLDPRFGMAGLIIAAVFLPSVVLWNWCHGEAGEQSYQRIEPIVHGVSLVVAIIAVAAYWWLAAKPVDEEPVVGWQQQATGQLWARNQADAHGYSHSGKLSIASLAKRL